MAPERASWSARSGLVAGAGGLAKPGTTRTADASPGAGGVPPTSAHALPPLNVSAAESSVYEPLSAQDKSCHAADGIDFLGQLVDRAGSTWLTGLFARIAMRVQPYNQIVSNVPGPQYPLYLLGARLLELYPMPPFQRQGLGTAVMSYDGRLFWCVLADRDVVRDVGELPHDVDAAFEELRAAAASP